MKLSPPAARRSIAEIPSDERFVFSRLSTLNVLLKRRAKIYAQEAFGFTLTQWRILTLLRLHAPVSIRDLALEALTDAAQVSRAAADLAKKGYLVRQKSPEDSREAQLQLTRKGMTAANEMYKASLQRNDELLGDCATEEIAAFASMLDRLIEQARRQVLADEQGCE